MFNAISGKEMIPNRMIKMTSLLVVFLVVACSAVVEAIHSINDLEFNEDSRLTSHTLLYDGNAQCHAKLANADLSERQIFPIENAELAAKYFPHREDSNTRKYNCAVVCLERGTHASHIYNPLDYHVIVDSNDLFNDINTNCQAAEVGFLSYLTDDSNVYWVNENEERFEIGLLKPGERNTFWIQSFLGHRFQIVDINEEVVSDFIVEYNAIIPVGQYTSHVKVRDVHEEVKRTLESEWIRANRVQRTFTEFGFSKGRLPADIFSSMSSFYYNNRDKATIEEWGGKGVFVNWWEKDVFFVAMPFKLKKHWQARLKTLVEAWVGVPLELTDIYGMRRYEDGARLLTHVDREATHATSLIVNVAQGGIREPWKIEIYDFAHRLHEIEMQEGDIVYYESARCLHGRMQPLQGAFYVNLFAHYRPVGDPEWFLKPNPPDTTERVMDIGKCHSNGTHAICDKHETPYLSPKLETLHGPRDLYRFWEENGKKHVPTASAKSEL